MYSSVTNVISTNSLPLIGPPIEQEVPQKNHIVLGEQLQITCTATNDQDAPMKLMFSWSVPDGVMFNNITTDEDDSQTASSTLLINSVTRNHSGEYQCIVWNDEHRLSNSYKAMAVIVEGNYTTS